MAGDAVPRDAFDLDRLPPHLRPRFRVVDEGGGVLAEGDDLTALRDRLAAETREAVAAAGHPIERTGITSWDFGELPRVVEVGSERSLARAYPALVDEGDSVAVRLLATPEEQADAMWSGTARLLLLQLPSPAKLLRPLVTETGRRVIRAGPHASQSAWVDDCVDAALGKAVADAGGPAWNGVDFDALLDKVGDALPDALIGLAEVSLELLLTYGDVVTALEGVPTGLFDDSADDVAAQLNRLVYPGFVAAVGAARLPDVHRYLRGAAQRLEKLPANPQRDRDGLARIRTLEAEHDRLIEAIGLNADLIDVAWQLEELRISLFAQSLGTRGKVSEKRIRQRLEEIAVG
jgi:ATP-dependent helicase HrpA